MNKKALKKCAWDIVHCTLSGGAMVLACVLAAYTTAKDTDKVMYETFGCASVVVVSGGISLLYSCKKLAQHLKELTKGD